MKKMILSLIVLCMSLYAEYEGFEKTLEIKTGWNLVALPIEKSLTEQELLELFDDDVSSIWKYDNGWSVTSPSATFLESAQNAGISVIDGMNNENGFWVNSSADITVNLSGSGVSVNYNGLFSGWNLVGTSTTIDDFTATFTNANTIWAYNEGWSAYSPDPNIQSTIENSGITVLTSINPGQGFWINQKELSFNNSVALGLLSDTTINGYAIDNLSTSLLSSTSNSNSEFDLDTLSSEQWIVLQTSNGTINDTDYDGIKDTSSATTASLHTILHSSDLENGVNFNILNEIAYIILEDRFSDYNSTYTPESDLNYIALQLIENDLDIDGYIDYRDMLHFDRNDTYHLSSLKFDIDQLQSKLEDDNTTIYQKIFSSSATKDHIIELFGDDIVPAKEATFIEAEVTLDVPENVDNITIDNIEVESMVSEDLEVYEEQTTMLVAEDENNNTILLGYSIPQTLQDQVLSKKGFLKTAPLYKTTPTNIEVSTESTALALTMMMLQSGLSEEKKAEIASMVLTNSEFATLHLMVEAAFKADSTFLDSLMLNQDLVDQIKATAISVWEEYTGTTYQDPTDTNTKQTQSKILYATGAGIDWGWYDDTLWHWYGEGTFYNISGTPFIATANSGAKISLANPTMINYIARMYNILGEEIGSKLTSRNSTMIQKQINKGAAGRIIATNPKIAYIEYDQNWVSRSLNTWHLSTAVLGTFGSTVMFEPIDTLINNHKTVATVAECGESLFDTVDFVTNDGAWTMVTGFVSMNWPSLIETFSMCLIESDAVKKYASSLIKKQIKDTPKKSVKLFGTVAIKTSTPWGWAWIAAQAVNGPIPIATSWIVSPDYAGYDLTWTNGKVTGVESANQPPKAPAKVIPDISSTNTSALEWSFSAENSKYDSEATVTYKWIIDGTFYGNETVNVTFNSAGTKTVTLTITDSFGQTKTDSTKVYVTQGENPTIYNLSCEIDSSNKQQVNITFNVSDSDNDISTIKVYESYKDTNPTSLSVSSSLSTSITYSSSSIGAIYKPYIKVTDSQNQTAEKSCLVSGEAEYDFKKDDTDTTTVDLTKGLVAHYEFEDNVNDSSGNGNHGTENGGVSYSSGVIGKAGSFDGVDDYIEADQFKNIIGSTTSWSTSIWVNFTYNSKDSMVLTDYDSSTSDNNYGLALQFQSNNTLRSLIRDKAISNNFGIHNQMPTEQTWHLLTTVVDKFNGLMKFYIDDSLVETTSISSNGNYIDNGRLFIGAVYHQNTMTQFYNGLADDLRIYNRALNTNEIGALYEMGNTSSTDTTSVSLTKGLVAHYEFEDNPNDSSGNGNHGTENGGVSYSSGVIGKAGSFDGVDDWISIDNHSFKNETLTKLTITGWIKTNRETNSGYNGALSLVRSNGSGCTQITYGGVYSSNLGYDTSYFGISDDATSCWGSSSASVYGDSKQNNDTWTFIVGVYDGNTAKMYYDGKLVDTYDKSNISITGESLQIAYQSSKYPNRFLGQIDDLRIYNRVLSINEINALYEMGDTSSTDTTSVSLTKGLVAHYEFEDNANDSSGNGNHGTENGGVSYSSGLIGNAGSFDGVDDYFSVNIELDGSADYSICSWINFNELDSSYSDWQQIISNQNEGVYFGVDLNPLGFSRHGLVNPVSYNIKTNEFYNLCFIQNNGSMAIYIDSKEIQNSSTNLKNFTTLANIGHWVIGDSNPMNREAFNGQMDDLRIYNRSLNENEIIELYKLGIQEN